LNPTTPASKKRVALASFEFEGNDFSPKVSGRSNFRPYAVGKEVLESIRGRPLAVTGGLEVLQAVPEIEVVPILVAHGGSGGIVEEDFYHRTTQAILAGIRADGPFDGVFLALHGAMITRGVPDAEGELLTAVRQIVGEAAFIAASLDLHAHVTKQMVGAADILVGYANYPHDDAHNTGKRSAALLRDSLLGKVHPVMSMRRREFLVPIPGSSTLDPEAPLYQIRAFSRNMEGGAVLSTSYFTVQPWLDDDEAGCVALAITDNAPALANEVAEKISNLMWDLRERFELPLVAVDEAIAVAMKAPVRPVILADAADCVGGGATGDTAYVLEALLRLARNSRCALSLVDPLVASKAFAAGVGATLSSTIGYRLDGRYGQPIPFTAEVLSLHDGKFIYAGGPAGGVEADMGPTAVLKAGEILIVVASRGTYEYGDEQFSSVGVDVNSCDIVVLKNGMNFRNLLRPGMTWMLVDSIGSTSPKLSSLPWKNRAAPFWPRDEQLPGREHLRQSSGGFASAQS
jgi:microcystin degradation protein MlrC